MQVKINAQQIVNATRTTTTRQARDKYAGWSYKSEGCLLPDAPRRPLWLNPVDNVKHLNPEAVVCDGEDGKPLVAQYTAANTYVFRVFHDESNEDVGFATPQDALMAMYGYDITQAPDGTPLVDENGNPAPIHIPGLMQMCRGIEFRLLKHPTNGTYFWCDKWHCEERDGKEA